MGFDAVKPILDAVTSQINVTTIVAVLGGALAASIGLAFFWWAGRKLLSMLMAAFKKGKVKV